MLNLVYPLPVKFICGFIYSQEDVYKKAIATLRKKFGHYDFESERIDFTFTDYYYPEMGKPLWRKFHAFQKLKDPSEFAAIKLFCIKLERGLSIYGKRIVNIDPGYITEAKLVLTTTKDFAHRIYLGKGIFAEVTLFFQNGVFHALPTTFPDYRTDQYKTIFMDIRNAYRQQILVKKKNEKN